MAPEVILNKSISRAADYYSVGILTYEMTLGEAANPLRGKGKKEILAFLNTGAIQVKKSELPENYSFKLADFIDRLLQRDPENRLGYENYYQIQTHKWIKNFSWDRIQNKVMEAPFIPQV
mmetsp:Transcript_16695/g.14575  ORF Transcript_16695/g.14575 Transcript_16695/m.14575 type:complete len:120 (+) Transcript_16695:541-900(+)